MAKGNGNILFRAFVSVVMVAMLVSGAWSNQAICASEVIEVKPSPKAEEKLFLVRMLDSLYEAWPRYSDDPQSFSAAAESLRTLAIRYREHIKRNQIDADLEACYAEYITNLDAYKEFTANIDEIKKQAANQSEKDDFNSGYKAGATGAATYGALRSNDESHDNTGAAAVAVVAALGTYLWDSHEKSQARDTAAQRAVSAAEQKLRDRVTASLENAKATAGKLAKANGWQDGEIGFDLTPEDNAAIQKLLANNDIAGLLAVSDGMAKKRPRDVFLILQQSSYAAYAESKDWTKLLQYAKKCVDAAALVPAPELYDDITTVRSLIQENAATICHR